MPTRLTRLITMQKVLKTCSNKSVKQQCLGITQEPKKQLRKCCNLDFSGPVYSKTPINTCKAVIDFSELALYPEEMKCC